MTRKPCKLLYDYYAEILLAYQERAGVLLPCSCGADGSTCRNCFQFIELSHQREIFKLHCKISMEEHRQEPLAKGAP